MSTGLFLVFPLANAPASRSITAFYRAVIRRLLYGRENHCHSGKIQEAALAEFQDKGFQGTSLRQIVKNAGVTTGAFYGYFSSKEALFNALVEPHATALMGKFMEAQISFAELPEEQQLEHTGVESGTYLDWMGQHREPVKLLLTRAEGTSYERFVHNMVEVEVEYTLQYMEVLRIFPCWTNPCATSLPAE